MTTKLAVPSIHTNGTSRERLLEDILIARQATRDAIKALCETAPNGRDYYPQGDAAFKQARDEHIARIERLHSVAEELREIAEHIHFSAF